MYIPLIDQVFHPGKSNKSYRLIHLWLQYFLLIMSGRIQTLQ